jgi:hypothetical protein
MRLKTIDVSRKLAATIFLISAETAQAANSLCRDKLKRILCRLQFFIANSE